MDMNLNETSLLWKTFFDKDCLHGSQKPTRKCSGGAGLPSSLQNNCF